MTSFADSLRAWLPPWLSDRASKGKSAGFRLLYGIAWLVDAALDMTVESVRARFPASAPPGALPYLARDRRIYRGPVESDDAFASQLVAWLTCWRVAGHAYALARGLQAFQSPHSPRIRVVTRGGVWWTLEPTGELRYHRATPNNWDWDSLTGGDPAAWWDVWVIIYPPTFAPDGQWSDPGTWGPGKAFGLDISTETVASLRALIDQWKGAHTRVVQVVVCYDATLFEPTAPPGDPRLPDGRWGLWGKMSGGACVPARSASCRYMEV
jgi:hypothetical protein